MADRLAKMKVSTLSNTLTVLDANALVENLVERLAKVKVITLCNIFSKVESGELGETLSE